MQEQKNNYNDKEVDKEQFVNLATELYKWAETKTVPLKKYSNNNLATFKQKEKLELLREHLLNQPTIQNDFNIITKILLSETGEKHNKGKLPMSKLFTQFPDALQAVVLASCYGHHRYPKDVDWLNFKRVPGGSQAFKDACLRHSLGAEKDEESGLPEVFHQAWNKLAELQLWLEENNINIKKFSKEYLDNLK